MESTATPDVQLLETAVLTGDPEAIMAYRARVAMMELAEYEAMCGLWQDYTDMEKIIALPDYARVLTEERERGSSFASTMALIGHPIPDIPEICMYRVVLKTYQHRTTFPERVIALMQVIEWVHPDIELGDDTDDEDGPDEISRMSYSDVCLELLSLPETEWWLAVLLYQKSRFNYDQVWTREQAGEALRDYLLEYVPAQA